MQQLSERDYIRAWIMKDSLNFTRYFFKKQNDGKKFVVGLHHRLICDKLNDVLEGRCKKLIINMPPRYSKTELAVKSFMAMGLAMNPRSSFLHLSYSNDLAVNNSVAVKEIVTSVDFHDLFNVHIKFGSDTKKHWETVQGGGVYATSTLGPITGFGAGAVEEPGKPYLFSGAVIIDDPIKPQDALSDTMRENVNLRFESTIRNRINSRDTPFIIIMQRLHENDLCGYLMKKEPGEWTVLSLPALTYDEEGNPSALWEFKHTTKELLAIRDANEYVFDTQYMQKPTPLGGLMYQNGFKTYSVIPATRTRIRKNYTDSADKGADYLCSIDYVETEIGNYILDVLYTQKPMEYTEPTVGAMLMRDGIDVANIEGNNGGEGFARNVERETRAAGNSRTRIVTFHQGANKQTRIFSRSNDVQNLTYFPEGWETMWPAFHDHLCGFRKDGTNEHDDAEDALTGTVEMRGQDMSGISYYEGEPEGEKVLFCFPSLDGMLIILHAVVGSFIDLTDVVYTTEYSDALIAEKIAAFDGDDIVIETDHNFLQSIKSLRENHHIRLMRRNPNPALRITAQRDFIKNKVRFRPDYAVSVDYTAFIDAMQDYSGKDNFGALDAVAALSAYVRKKFGMQ